MSLYKQINKFCEMGFYPIISDGQKYIIVSPTKDTYNYWRDTGVCSSLEKAIKHIGNCFGYSKKECNKKEKEGFKITSFYHPPVKRFQVGDKVKVREDLKDLQFHNYWDQTIQEYKNTVGMQGTIDGFGNTCYYVYFDTIKRTFGYRQDELEPYIEQPKTTPTINIGGKNYEITPELTKALKNLKEIN